MTAQVRRSSDHKRSPKHHDDLPPFHALTTDDEREKKAETQSPGTFGVVVTPESFADLPEYAISSPNSRRMSFQSRASSLPTQVFDNPLSRTLTDPNVVVLDRFEDVPVTPTGPFQITSPARRTSLPQGLEYLSISKSLSGSAATRNHVLPSTARSDSHLIAHFRHYIIPRLVQPQAAIGMNNHISPWSTADSFETEATRFQPVSASLAESV